MTWTEVPIVDMARWRGAASDRSALAEEVRSVCHDVGFFVVIDHGIEATLIDRLFATMRDLFDLDAEQKETEAGIADMASPHRPATYGEQLWNYFRRSYPENFLAHYPAQPPN